MRANFTFLMFFFVVLYVINAELSAGMNNKEFLIIFKFIYFCEFIWIRKYPLYRLVQI